RAEPLRELGPQHLDRDGTVVAEVAREVDARHPSGAQLPLDVVAVGERRGDRPCRVVHARNSSAPQVEGVIPFRYTPRPVASPHRLAWPRTPPFQGGDTGSNPVGDASTIPA